MGVNLRSKQLMINFRLILEFYNLMDLGHRGDQFTWSNKHEDHTFIKERLDCALANPAWVTFYNHVFVENLLVWNSDHYGIVACCLNNFSMHVVSRGSSVVKLAGTMKKTALNWCTKFGIILPRVPILIKNLTRAQRDYPIGVNRKIDAHLKTSNV